MKNEAIIIGITGASGSIYGVRLLELLKDMSIAVHLVITKAGMRTLLEETSYTLDYVYSLADKTYPVQDIGAAIASGSFLTKGMIIAPCSIRSMSAIALGITNDLLTRAADVVMKERRKLVIMVRETPLHAGHLQNMLQLSQMGAIIAPPVPAFYNKPMNIQDIIDHSLGRVLDLFDIHLDHVKRWT